MSFMRTLTVNEKIHSIFNTLDSIVEQEYSRSNGEIPVASLIQPPESQLVDHSSTSCKSITTGSEMLSLQQPTKDSSIGLMELCSYNNGSSYIKEISTEDSLSILLSILAGWVSRCLEKIPSHPGSADLVDWKDYADKEIEYGLDILKKLNKRVDTLLKSAKNLPDPSTILAIGLEGKKRFFCDRLNDSGLKVKHRLETLELEGSEDYSSFITAFNDIAKLNRDEIYMQELKVMTFSIVTNTIINAAENVMMLSLEIQNFRNKIREFCAALDKVM